MAPESINFRKFSSNSDVWMFGIYIYVEKNYFVSAIIQT